MICYAKLYERVGLDEWLALLRTQAQGPSILLARSAHSRQNWARMGTRKRLLVYGSQDDEV
jgi:hypothetical protein